MKVLKFKKIYDFKAKEKCEICKAKLELEEKDVKLVPEIRFFDIKYFRAFFSCPICKNLQELTYKNGGRFALYRRTKKCTNKKVVEDE